MHTSAKPLRIGIIDSGIDIRFLQIVPLSIVAGASFKIDWVQKKLDSIFYDEADIANWRNNLVALDIDDQSGHGTAVASILHCNISVPVEFYIAKILDAQTSGSVLCLMEAMNWLINTIQVQYVNLSLGTNNWQFQTQMTELVYQAKLKNCQLFSAAGDVATLPSELDGVTAVGTRKLAQDNKAGVKLDCIALPCVITLFQNNGWVDSEMTTSYACPLMLSEYCNVF